MQMIKSAARSLLFNTSTRVDTYGYRWIRQEASMIGHIASLRKVRKAMPSAEEYLKRASGDYPYGSFLLEHGSSFTPPPYKFCREMEADNVYLEGGKCFTNSLLVAHYRDISGIATYAEGIAVNPYGAYLHAWVVVNGSQVFDPTWRGGFQTSYFGISITSEEMVYIAKRLDPITLFGIWELSEPHVRKLVETRT